MPISSRHSWGLTALAATSTLGWLIYKSLASTTPRKPKNKKNKKKKGKKSQDGREGPFDFVKVERSSSSVSQTSTLDTAASTLGEEEIEQVWTSKGDVDLKIFRQLIKKKQQKKPWVCRAHSKTLLFSHLLSKLEQTLDERDRIEGKLDLIRDVKGDATSPSISRFASSQSIPPAAIQPQSNTSMVMVVQRYRGASLSISDDECVRVGTNKASSSGDKQACCGLLVYVSFAKGCNQQTVQAASKIVVNLPILTVGAWGDGVSKTMNVIDLAKQHPDAASLVIVPQANLINKVKSQGKSLQYHGQIDKDEGNTLYQYFVNQVRGLVLEQQCKARKEALPNWYKKSCSAQSGSSPQKASPSTPPEDLFRDTSLYTSWDDNGIPLADAEKEPLTKSAQKKMRKAQAAHRVRHLKFLRERRAKGVVVEKQQQKTTPSPEPHKEHWANATDPSFVQVVAGSFGKRQSLEMSADMGPFCHVIQV